MDKTLIERAIDSAKHRQYKLSADLKRDISLGHRKKAEKQREVAEVTVQALERMMPKKPDWDGLYVCPSCRTIMLYGAFEAKGECCKYCGQRLDWGE